MAAEQGLVRLAVLSAFDVEKPEPETYLKDDFTADVFNSSGLFYQFTERDPGVQTYPSNIPSLTSLDFGLDEEECDEYANFIGRNSVSILSELRQDASYRLVYSSNNVKTPKFVMTCKLDGQMFRGEAPSKKLAKARAARDALQELFGIEFSHVEGLLISLYVLHSFRSFLIDFRAVISTLVHCRKFKYGVLFDLKKNRSAEIDFTSSSKSRHK